MFSAFIITFRETLEVALIVSIIATVLIKTNQQSLLKFVWIGICSAIVVCVISGFGLQLVLGGLEGQVEMIFEGSLMLLTAGFLTWMIVWVHRQQDIVLHLKTQTNRHVQGGFGIGIFLMVFTSVVREGLETVLYLIANRYTTNSIWILGAVFGIVAALLLGFGIYRYGIKMNLSLVFKITTILLTLFGASLCSNAVQEFQEAGLIVNYSFIPLVASISYVLGTIILFKISNIYKKNEAKKTL